MKTLRKILNDGFVEVDINLEHFEFYEKGDTRLLYNKAKKEIVVIYNVKDVWKDVYKLLGNKK